MVLRTPKATLFVRLFVTAAASFLLGGFIYGAIFRSNYQGWADHLITGAAWAFLWPAMSGTPEAHNGNALPAVIGTWLALFYVWRYSEYRSYLKRHPND
jgi:hypothetical protein